MTVEVSTQASIQKEFQMAWLKCRFMSIKYRLKMSTQGSAHRLSLFVTKFAEVEDLPEVSTHGCQVLTHH